MPRIGPIRRQDFIFYLRRMGFEGPYAGGRHQIMQKGLQTVRVPNPHRGDISTGLLARILRDSGIDRAEWEKL
jgi:predicted RNA binding protein YcfA (HicA-like mRNA interferase family)